VFSLQETSTLLGERIRDRRGRNEAARDQDLAEALARALLLGERLDQILLADQASFHQQRAKPTPTRICRIHTYAYQPPRREQRLIREPTQLSSCGHVTRPPKAPVDEFDRGAVHVTAASPSNRRSWTRLSESLLHRRSSPTGAARA
jgi:hypothetical protein